jgi:hypothetical protein
MDGGGIGLVTWVICFFAIAHFKVSDARAIGNAMLCGRSQAFYVSGLPAFAPSEPAIG